MAEILIADDDAHIARVMSIWLSRHGHRVTTVRNGQEALELLERQTVEVIISDMNMPLVDGIGLAKGVRQKLGSDVPILMLSARCDQAVLTEQLAAFGVRVYPKPFLPSQLVAEIERVLVPARVGSAVRTPCHGLHSSDGPHSGPDRGTPR